MTSVSSGDWTANIATLLAILQFILAAAVVLRVVFTRRPPGSSMAWIVLAVVLPFVGFFLYVLFGERSIGRWRMHKMKSSLERFRDVIERKRDASQVAKAEQEPARSLIAITERVAHLPATEGSNLELIGNASDAIDRILKDIRAAKQSIDMEFYIWSPGGKADEIANALIEAAERGVKCRVLVDAVGARPFLGSTWPVRMKVRGVQIATALPVQVLAFGSGRADIRLHRKTIVIDGMTAYTGSLNLIDPEQYAMEQNVSNWVDAMVRVTGTAVADLATVFALDWTLQSEKEQDLEISAPACVAPAGSATVATIPSGPDITADANLRVLIEAVNKAQKRILITTPYFVPGESLLMALQNAALRGVDVHLCVPLHPDSKIVQWAGHRYFSALLEAGVQIFEFTEGMLHTKAVTIDDEITFFGTLNMDNRSLMLNFELMLMAFDKAFAERLSALQLSYEAASRKIDPMAWKQRRLLKRFSEGVCYLASPLL